MSTSQPVVSPSGDSGIPSSASAALQSALQLFQCSGGSNLVYSTKHSYVFRSHSRIFERDIAIKLLLTETIPVQAVKKFVARELIVTRSVDHPHLLRSLDVSVNDSVIIIATPFCSRGNLFGPLREKKNFSEIEAARIFRQLIEAIAYLHRNNVAHRDVKLENILLTDRGDVKLIDYGFAIPMKDRRQRARSRCGTKGYMAPSITSGKPYDPFATDYFACGHVLHTLLVGKFPGNIPIRSRRYFPSESSWNLVSALMNSTDEERPGYEQIIASEWIQRYAPLWMFSNHETCFFEVVEAADEVGNILEHNEGDVMSPPWWLALLLSVASALDGVNRRIGAERPVDFKIELCSHERHPMHSETMLFFPETVKYCASLRTNKQHSQLEADRRFTTFLQPVVEVTWKALDSYDECTMEFIGYQGEYRLSPDLGYYTSCQRSISQYINHLDYLACDFIENKWYQLEYKSAIKYETFYNKLYHSHWANYSTSYVFKPERVLMRNGTEIDWLHRMVTFKLKRSNCSMIRYLVYLDKDWTVPMTVFIDYHIRGKYSKHLANGTIDEWHNGRFYMFPVDWDHDLCIRVSPQTCGGGRGSRLGSSTMTKKSSKLYFNADKAAQIDQTDDVKKLAKKTHKALRQLHRHDPEIEVSDSPTNKLFVANSSVLCGVRPESLVAIFRAFDADCKCVVFQSTRNYSFVQFSGEEKAQKALAVLHGTIPAEVRDESNHAFYMAFVKNLPKVEQKQCERPDGLNILEDFVAAGEEEALIKLVDSYPSSSSSSSSSISSSKTPIKHRHVLHFGSIFDYDTNSSGAEADSVPEQIKDIIDRLIGSGLINEAERPDQVTVNFYEANQEKPTGIPPHVDAHSPFEEPVISLSLQSKVVMDFRDCANPNVHLPLVLEPRSLLVMRGAARYRFTHGIATRRYDVNPQTGDVFDRQRRISITFRRIRKEPCQCPYIEYCDWDRNGQTALPKTDKQAKQIEDRYVAEIYESIASHFDETRHSKWNAVSNFLASIPGGSLMFDIGCGNGKYLFDDNRLIKFGLDYCMNLCEIVQQKGFNIVRGDSLSLPFKSESADAVLCIAVIHHFSTHERRLETVREMGRLLRPGGKGIITVWSMDQKKSFFQEYREKRDLDGEDKATTDGGERLLVHSGSVFKQSDMLVPWQDGSGTQYLRYYHLFQECELEGLVESAGGLRVNSSINEQGNWIMLTRIISRNLSSAVAVRELVQSKEATSNMRIQGWVRKAQKMGKILFLHVNDGMSAEVVQVVVPRDLCRSAPVGSAVSIEGDWKPSLGAQQAMEFQATKCDVVGRNDNNYIAKKDADKLRLEPHLRPKAESFAALLRLRSHVTSKSHEYFKENGYTYIDTPMVSLNDCEGAGEAFTLKAPKDDDFFGRPDVYLPVSGQLHLEAIVGAIPRVYTIGTAFRAEKCLSRQHMAEFKMLEAECGFIDSLDQLCDVAEGHIRHVVDGLAEQCVQLDIVSHADVYQSKESKSLVDLCRKVSRFPRLTYSDALELLQKHGAKVGPDGLKKNHELKLVQLCESPVFVTHFPVEQKPFYMKRSGDKALCFDLLAPFVGELAGGSLRENDTASLEERLPPEAVANLAWYLELRRCGQPSSGGFGIGVERLLQAALSVVNIKDTVAFPRWFKHCKC
ncbi:hypothetical protein QR680_007635 [Steinernema hermaphroditum]|uniref:tRNA (carboxymethyluridine(34)-5-O)-methyltransferase n=1 Tax=Steinernema hermaphroditum TaxID=289476 RepID=A0AA39IF72_9BILA|nr:hypothetical protein QR680_007635 [Steinernema hermaphroditum]